MKSQRLTFLLVSASIAMWGSTALAQWGATFIEVPNGKEVVFGSINTRPYAIVLRHDDTCTIKRLYDRNGHWGNTILYDHTYAEVATTSFDWCGRSITPLDTGGETFGVYLGDGAARTFVNQGNPYVIAFGGDGDDAIANMIPTGSSGWSAAGGEGNDLLLGVQGATLSGEPGDDVFCVVPGESATLITGDDGGDAVCGSTDAYETIEWYDPNCSCF